MKYEMALFSGMVVACWTFVVGAMKISAYFYTLAHRKTAIRAVNALILPYLLPAFGCLVIVGADQFMPFYPFDPTLKTFGSKVWSLFSWAYSLTFAAALYVVFSGGSWLHETKTGQPDRRYKHNEYYPHFDDSTKAVAKQFLFLPGISVIIFIAFQGLQHFLSKA